MKLNLSTLLCFFLLTNILNAQQKKYTVAVLNFVNSGGVDKNEISILTNRFSNYLVNVGVYKILEREKMDAILKEQDFTMSDNCNSSECAIQIGQLLGVERMITGNIGLFGQMWTLDVRVVDVSTGEVLRTQSENYEGKKEGLLSAIESLAYAVCGATAPYISTTKTTTDKSSSVTVAGKTNTEDGGDEIKIGNVTKNYGSLEINNELEGMLYIDSKQIGEVTEGSVIPIDKLKVGEHTIRITYSGGEFEEKVNIEYNQKIKLTTKRGASFSSFTDPRDGKTYKTVKIGSQVWMAENLNYEVGEGCFCYDNNISNCNKYGKLYTWDAAKRAVPSGWHLPSKAEWETLLNYLGGSGSTAYNQMIAGGHSGFTALFGGWRRNAGNYYDVGEIANFWSSSEDTKINAWYRKVNSNDQKAYMGSSNKNFGFSVRCFKD
ncbi:hypothetical protein JNL27_15870 [bacterium]|nr:hypothetical protein [bacterium]